jgi:tetratricopeptide (TPR) repeat protein
LEEAADLEQRGEIEQAQMVLYPLWQGIHATPKLDGLEKATQAALIMRAASLTSRIGSEQAIAGAQNVAKDLVSDAIRRFDQLEMIEGSAEARKVLALCYWREGGNDEARAVLKDAIERFGQRKGETLARLIHCAAIIERVAGNCDKALALLQEHAELFKNLTSAFVKGNYHNELGIILRRLAQTTGNADLRDTALIEFTAATVFYEEARCSRLKAATENNLGLLYADARLFKEAHKHLATARRIYQSVSDKTRAAQVDDSNARVYLQEGKYKEARESARRAVEVLRDGEDAQLYSDALTTEALANIKQGRHERARNLLNQVLQIAERCGSDATEARTELARLDRKRGPSLFEKIATYESELVRQALKDAEGRVTFAARYLGISHQALDSIIERHPELISFRIPKRTRRHKK